MNTNRYPDAILALVLLISIIIYTLKGALNNISLYGIFKLGLVIVAIGILLLRFFKKETT